MTIAVIDYGMGNLRSVVNAFEAVGGDVEVARSPHDLSNAQGIVLPGVGAFHDGMTRLKGADWVAALHSQVIEKGKPFLGLCLGMQLMASRGTEHGVAQGLGWIDGEVVRLDGGNLLKVPHVGWNDVSVVRDSRLFEGLGECGVFYFLHSYHLRLHQQRPLVGTCNYGEELTAAIESDNLFGVQFHPEKSQRAGLRILQNFVAMAVSWA